MTSVLGTTRVQAAIVALLSVIALSACNTAGSPTSPSVLAAAPAALGAATNAAVVSTADTPDGRGHGVSGPSTPIQPVPVQPASESVVEAMTTAIQDEYHAQWTYQGVLDDFNNVRPFANIVKAEEQHVSSMAGLFERRSLTVPQSDWSLGNVPRFASVREACAAAVGAEQANIAMYDSFLTMGLPTDVRQVFQNLRSASLTNHLPAFESCR